MDEQVDPDPAVGHQWPTPNRTDANRTDSHRARHRRSRPASVERVIIARWTGDEVWRLRTAKRLSVRSFAAWLGVSHRMVSKWEAGTVPGPENQAALDTALRMCTDVETSRFRACPSRSVRHEAQPEPAYESTQPPRKQVAPSDKQLPTQLWEDDGVRTALREHDIGYLFKVLQHQQVSQRAIARMVGMQQSEISEVLAGRRVRQYDALVRICIGLHIPRHLMGLSFNADLLPVSTGTASELGPDCPRQ